MSPQDSEPELEVPRTASFSSADSANHPGEGRIVRLSEEGLEIVSHDTLPPAGATVVVWAELLEGEGVVTLGGRVQWSGGDRFSVEFDALGVEETISVARASRRPPPP
jgi:hypothetical protein